MENLIVEKEASSRRQRAWWFHWQNLNDRKEGAQGSPIRHGRCWWHFPDLTIQFCWNLWSHFCGIQLDWDDEDVTLMLALPPVSLWLSLSSNWPPLKKLLPHRPLQCYPDTIIVDEREIGISIHGGRLWIQPYCRKNEWKSKDPWWLKGISFNLNPFEPVHMRHEVRRSDGTWSPFVGSWEEGPLRVVND